MKKNLITNFISDLLGRRVTYRLGRAMYLYARGDTINNMKINGEMVIQSGVLVARKQKLTTTSRLIIFDVGANIGEWSSAMIDSLRKHNLVIDTDLFAFEPVPSTAETLKKTSQPMRRFCTLRKWHSPRPMGRKKFTLPDRILVQILFMPTQCKGKNNLQ